MTSNILLPVYSYHRITANMATPEFFEQLEDFLPQHISRMPSYAHASVALAVTGLVTYILGAKYLVADFNQDDQVSEAEERAKKYVQAAASLLISVFIADAVFNVSFRIRGFRTNKRHFVYKTWFPRLYSG